MSRSAARPTTRRDTVLFLGCVVLSLFLLAVPEPWTGPLTGTVRETALRPLLWLQRRGEEGRTSRTRLQEVVAERDAAAIRARTADDLERENEELRGLLGLQERLPDTFLAADILHQPLPTDGRTLLLSIGRTAGAAPFQPVVTPSGLVGVLVRVEAGSSVAHTWAHPEFRASAVTAHGEVLGIVAPTADDGPGLQALEFRGVAYRDTVPEGTLVMTSGLGGVYPRGIAIGRVSGVRREELGWERVYRLTPAVNPGLVGHVLILTRPVVPALKSADSLPPASQDSLP